jgi:hypothetical protein
MSNNWLLDAWKLEPKYYKVGKQFERSSKLENYPLPPAWLAGDENAEKVKKQLLSHLRSPEEFVTQILFWLLAARDSHGQWRFQCFRDKFMELYGINKVVRFEAEYSEGEDRYDLVGFDNDNRLACILENKINAQIGDDQLSRYWNKLKNVPESVLGLLTLFNEDTNGQVVEVQKLTQKGNCRFVRHFWHDIYSLLEEIAEEKVKNMLKTIFEYFQFDIEEYSLPRKSESRKSHIERIETLIHKKCGDSFLIKANYPRSLSSVSHITIYCPNNHEKIIGTGSRTIKFLPALLVLCDGFRMHGKRTGEICSIKCGILHRNADGNIRSTKNMIELDPKEIEEMTIYDTRYPDWQNSIHYPSEACPKENDFWQMVEKVIGDAIEVFKIFLLNKTS